MNPFTKRNLLITVSVFLFFGILSALNSLAPVLGTYIQHLEFMAIGLMILMSLVIMLFWSLLGVFGGLASFLTAMIFLYKPLTALDPYYYAILILAFFANSVIGYSIHRKISRSQQKHTVTVEKVQEDTNLIRNHLKTREAEVSAMGEKIVSMLKLKNIADGLSSTLESDEIIKIISEETFSLFGENTRVLLFLVEDDSNRISLSHMSKVSARKPFAAKNGGIFDRWTMKNMKSLLVKDIRKDFRFSVNETELKDDAISIISKPLITEGNVFGVLRVDSPHEGAFEQYELRLLDIIGELAAVALENARLYHQTEELAIKDSLTGLYVHRYFMERLDEEIKRGLRSNSSFGLFMLDIDDFKKFNDKYGHISGDAVLKNIARVLKSKASAGDFICRYGGEEFTFLTLNCDREKAVALANSIRKEIQASPVVLRREKCSVTVSVGIAIFPDDAKLREDLIWEADKRLYKAKTKGKNNVCSK